MKRTLTIKWCLLVVLLVCLCTPALALAQWGYSNYGGDSGYSSYYSEESYYSDDNGGYGWLSYVPALGSCNRIEIDD